MNIIYVAAVSVVILLASLLLGGLYTLVPVSNTTAVGTFVMNRLTGRIWLCNVNSCRVIPNQQPAAGN